VRDLWDRDQQSHSLVCDSMRCCRAHGSSMEHTGCQCGRVAAFLRRSSRPDLHQPMVRGCLYASKARFSEILSGAIVELASGGLDKWREDIDLLRACLLPLTLPFKDSALPACRVRPWSCARFL